MLPPGFPVFATKCGKGYHADGKNHFDGQITRCTICNEVTWATREYREEHPEIEVDPNVLSMDPASVMTRITKRYGAV